MLKLIDTVNQVKEASLHSALNATAMEDIDFSSASAGPSGWSQVFSVSFQVPRWKGIDFKKYFLEK